MRKFECPVCHKQTRVYAKDRKYIVSANCAIRYRRCKSCGTKMVTKEDLDTKEEELLHLIYRSNRELLFYDEASWID